MKTIVLFGLSMALATTVTFGQATSSPLPGTSVATPVSGPKITFEETKFDFGSAKEGDKVEHTFKFTNTGNQPLILSNVQTTCGCTVPEWPKEPIMPGKNGTIKATFNTAGKGGQQNKIITIISNAAEGNTMISMQGTVTARGQATGTGQPAPAARPHNHPH